MKAITLIDITNNRNQTIKKGEEVKVFNVFKRPKPIPESLTNCTIKNEKGYEIITRFKKVRIIEESNTKIQQTECGIL